MQSQKRQNELYCFQGKPFNITVIQVYGPISNAEEAEVESFYAGLQDGIEKKSENESDVTQSCPTLCDPMDYSLPRSSIHGIFQARVLEWVAISFSRGSSRPRDQIRVSHSVGRCFFTFWVTREAPLNIKGKIVMYSIKRPKQSHLHQVTEVNITSKETKKSE